MNSRSIVVVGLPSSGKTTFLAALWHVVTSMEVPTKLSFGGLTNGDISYLHEISSKWRDAVEQSRTVSSGTKFVQLKLQLPSGSPLELSFPDAPGEDFRHMWERRFCSEELLPHLSSSNVALFIHSDEIEFPRWVVDDNHVVELMQASSVGEFADDVVPAISIPFSNALPWSPELAPTQVQLVGLLQLLIDSPLNVGPRRLAIILSAWDLSEDEGYNPAEFLARKLPMLSKYLMSNASTWTTEIFGLSAQGGEYQSNESGEAPSDAVVRVREEPTPSKRIRLVRGDLSTNDLTEPLSWLLDDAT